MISKEFKISSISSVTGRNIEYHIIRIGKFVTVTFKNSDGFGKLAFKDGILLNESVIYSNGQKIYCYSSDNGEIRYLSKYDLDYGTMVYSKFFPINIEREINDNSEDETLASVYKEFIDYVVDIQEKIYEYRI